MKKIKGMKRLLNPIKLNKSKWAYRNARSIIFVHQQLNTGTRQTLITLSQLNKILNAK